MNLLGTYEISVMERIERNDRQKGRFELYLVILAIYASIAAVDLLAAAGTRMNLDLAIRVTEAVFTLVIVGPAIYFAITEDKGWQRIADKIGNFL